MKHLALIIAALLLAGSAFAAEKIVPGPKGGKMLDNQPAPRAEFYVDKDHKVIITFYGDDMKPVPAAQQTAVVWADAKTGRVKLEMERKGDVLVSKTSLPEGDGYNLMVQLKSTPETKPQSFKVAFHDETCSKCHRAEYACICEPDHTHEHKEDHDHAH